MRASNIPFGAAYVAGIALASRFAFRSNFAWFPFAFVPFVWFYMNEIRPYMMLIAFACATLSALSIYTFGNNINSGRAKRLIIPLFLVTWLTHILAILLLPAIALILLYVKRFRGELSFKGLTDSAAVWALPLILTAAYYGTTLAGGAAGAELLNNNRGNSPLASLAEIAYEQFGFGGLGPSRIALHGSVGFTSYKPYIGYILFGISGLSIAIFSGFQKPICRTPGILFASWLISLLFATIMSDITHVRFLGRHLAGTFPLLALAGISLSRSRIVAISLLAIFLVSDYRLSHVNIYSKDDYRGTISAVLALNRARPGAIDWAADDLTAAYYGLGLDITRNDKFVRVPWRIKGTAFTVQNYSISDAVNLIAKQRRDGKPIYLALSRPEIFDLNHGWRDMLKVSHPRHVAHLQAFDVFEFQSRNVFRK